MSDYQFTSQQGSNELLRLEHVFVHPGSEQQLCHLKDSHSSMVCWSLKADIPSKGPSRFSFIVSICVMMVLILFLTITHPRQPTKGVVKHVYHPFPTCMALMVWLKWMSKMQFIRMGLRCSISATASSRFRVKRLEWKVQKIEFCEEEGATLCVCLQSLVQWNKSSCPLLPALIKVKGR